MTTKQSLARYTLKVWIDRPSREEDDLEWMSTKDARRELEREVLRALKVVDGDADLEVLDVEIIHEDGPETLADRGTDTLDEYHERV